MLMALLIHAQVEVFVPASTNTFTQTHHPHKHLYTDISPAQTPLHRHITRTNTFTHTHHTHTTHIHTPHTPHTHHTHTTHTSHRTPSLRWDQQRADWVEEEEEEEEEEEPHGKENRTALKSNS